MSVQRDNRRVCPPHYLLPGAGDGMRRPPVVHGDTTMMRFHFSMRALACCLATAFLLLACSRDGSGETDTRAGAEGPADAAGGSTTADGATALDGSSEDAPSSMDGAPGDAGADGGGMWPAGSDGSDYELVSEPADCGLEVDTHIRAAQTCCNKEPCNGQCALFDGATSPVCWCAGVVGGCPLPLVCCWETSTCTSKAVCMIVPGM
jgi:hypothetical protein